MSQRPSILNTDLRLRAAFPDLKTEIFELGPRHHIIVAPAAQLNARQFAEEFKTSWRKIGDRVEFRNAAPADAKLIPSLGDHEIGTNLSGAYLNEQGLLTVIQGMFPKLPYVHGIRDGEGGQLQICMERLPEGDYVVELEAFLSASLYGRPYTFEIAKKKNPEPTTISPRAKALLDGISGLSIKPIHSRSSVPDFVKEEENWWFESLPKLFGGEITPTAITHSHGETGETACYINSNYGEQLDVRQLLVSYDVIYMEPPLTDVKDERMSFWSSQSVDTDDLLALIEANRVRLIHSQAEERGDLGFLREAKSANPKGVMGRRRTAALMIADIVETANEYLLGSPKMENELVELANRLSREHKAPHNEVAKALLFPAYMRRACCEPFNDRGLMGLWQLGQGELFAETFKRVRGKEIELEASSFSQAVHTAHMLDATYIPMVDKSGYVGSWIEPTKMMGERLNFYRSFNTRIAAAWIGNERRKLENDTILPAIPLLDFRDDVTVQDILKLTQPASMKIRGQALISRLSKIPEDERETEINNLTTQLAHLTKTQQTRNRKLVLADAAANLGAYALGFSMFPFSPAMLFFNEILKVAQRAPALDVILSEIELALEEQLGRNSDLSFLSKVSRVANIRAS